MRAAGPPIISIPFALLDVLPLSATLTRVNELGRQASIKRFWSHVDLSVPGPASCWPWTGTITRQGYGKTGGSPYWAGSYAHRWAWQMTNGPIPRGYEVEHACHTDSDCALGDDCPHRRCCNPAHLRLLTVAKHRRLPRRSNKPRSISPRGELCRHGHPWSIFGRTNSQGRLVCLECARESGRRHDAKRRAK
jgi:hypothetical protein